MECFLNIFCKQPDIWPTEPQISKNQASYFRALNRKFFQTLLAFAKRSWNANSFYGVAYERVFFKMIKFVFNHNCVQGSLCIKYHYCLDVSEKY